MLPSGKYYIGDLCYVIKDNWHNFCDVFIADEFCLEGEMQCNGKIFAIYNTKYGDGTYVDYDRYKYPVDSGSIGCIRIKDCEISENEIRERNLGRIETFEKPFNSGSDNRHIYFARGQINEIEINLDNDYGDDDEYEVRS